MVMLHDMHTMRQWDCIIVLRRLPSLPCILASRIALIGWFDMQYTQRYMRVGRVREGSSGDGEGDVQAG